MILINRKNIITETKQYQFSNSISEFQFKLCIYKEEGFIDISFGYWSLTITTNHEPYNGILTKYFMDKYL